MAIFNQTKFYLESWQYFVIIIQAIFFSYFGNFLSLKAIERAPNPGYSLIISKSYVVFTSIASVFLFSAPLTIASAVAIILIVGFSALIMIDRSKVKQPNSPWLGYTIGAFFCGGMLALTTKYLFLYGVPVLTRLIYSMLIVTGLILAEIRRNHIQVGSTPKKNFFILLFVGLAGAGFNYFMQVAIDLAPNVGYVNAANAASISLLTIASALIFHDELTQRKLLGVAGVTAGLIILFST